MAREFPLFICEQSYRDFGHRDCYSQFATTLQAACLHGFQSGRRLAP
jgi:hypothetical protein